MTTVKMTTVKTRSRAGRLAAAAGAVALAATGLTVGFNDTASAAGCYDSYKLMSKPDGRYYSPTGSGWYQTTSACKDINLRLNTVVHDSGRNVKVCFENGGCQEDWTWVKPGEWTEIATDVRDGSKFKFRFLTDGEVVARRAA